MTRSGTINQIGAWTSITARIIALALLLGVTLVATRLLIPGTQITEYREVPMGGSGPPTIEQVYYRPYPGAIGYLALAGLAVLGLIKRKLLPLAWASVILLTGWSSIWLFSSGAAFLLVDGLLLALLMLITITGRNSSSGEQVRP